VCAFRVYRLLTVFRLGALQSTRTPQPRCCQLGGRACRRVLSPAASLLLFIGVAVCAREAACIVQTHSSSHRCAIKQQLSLILNFKRWAAQHERALHAFSAALCDLCSAQQRILYPPNRPTLNNVHKRHKHRQTTTFAVCAGACMGVALIT